MSTPLTLTNARRPDGGRVLTVVGEIDMSNSRELAAAVEAEFEDTDGTVLLDLTRVEYLDSAGLSILLLHAERIEILATPLIAPVLTISGLPGLTTVHGLEPAGPGDTDEIG
jgi:anti-sigma B factor antagonist